MLPSEIIKKKFITYFVAEGYYSFNSEDLIPDKQDKSLLFTNSIMSRYKNEFAGRTQPLHSKIVTHQRCLKTGGQSTLSKTRHDLEEVGEGQSLSILEQLGVCCFNLNSKKELIRHVWHFFTKIMELPSDSFLIILDKKDIDVFNIFKQLGVNEDAIIKPDELQWRQFNDLGICGFCTHIIYDRGKELNNECKNAECNYNCNCGRFLDLGDIVFFDHKYTNKNVTKSDVINVDCGLGLERITMLMENSKSIFDISTFKPLIPLLETATSYTYNSDLSKDIAFKAIVDHIRTTVIAIGDNILPGKTKREHVVRRIIRHAIRSGWKLGIEEIFLHKLIDNMQALLCANPTFSYLKNTKYDITKVVKNEELLFQKIVKIGKKQFNKFIENNNILDGENIFILYDRYGIPIDFIEMLAIKNEIQLDYEGFYSQLASHTKKINKNQCF